MSKGRKHSSLDHNEVFFLAGTICAQATYYENGFRQRDLKFMIEMFSNWVDLILPDRSLFLHNVQIMRFLEDLVTDGLAKKNGKSKETRYRLTPAGLVEVTHRLVHRKPSFPLENFYFVLHAVDAYRPQIEALLKMEAKSFPAGLRMELESLLEIKKPIREYIDFLNFELKKLRARIEDSKQVLQLVKDSRQKKKSTVDIVSEIEKQFPYDLNSQKALTKFYAEMPTPVSDRILDVGLRKRTEQIWFPLEKVLDLHLQILKSLETRVGGKS